MRFSDYSRIAPDWVKDGKIYWIEEKIGNRDCIPLSSAAKEILDRYDGYAPQLTQQKFNLYLKLMCKEAGLTEKIPVSKTIGTQKMTEYKEKWELVSSHTARRTGATLLIKASAPAAWVMRITGHKSERSFWRYIRLSKEENADLIKGYMEKI